MRLMSLAVSAICALAVAGCDSQGNPPWKTGAGTPAAGKNTFKGTVKVEFLNPTAPADYYRDMKLLAPFGYVDPDGLSWDVPAGAITDGASVPWGFWNIVGGPYDGPYRDAAVIHDYFVDQKTRTWEDTHRMFYNAVAARGISDTLSRTMYAGVRYGGPRWEVAVVPKPAAQKSDMTGSLTLRKIAAVFDVAQTETKPEAPAATPAKPKPDAAAQPAAPESAPAAAAAQPAQPLVSADAPAPAVRSLGRSMATDSEMRTFDDLRLWIEREKPSLEEIDKRVEQMRLREGKPAVKVP